MSLLPVILDEFSSRPSRILNQHFGLGLEPQDFLMPMTIPPEARMLLRSPFSYYRPWSTQAGEKDAGSTVSVDKNKYSLNLDVQHFNPNEVTVKVTEQNTITVEGKHEERQDEHGYVSRQFARRYLVPPGHDMQKVECRLSSDGVLTITAPKVGPEGNDIHRLIPITQTGIPSKGHEKVKTEDKNN